MDQKWDMWPNYALVEVKGDGWVESHFFWAGAPEKGCLRCCKNIIMVKKSGHYLTVSHSVPVLATVYALYKGRKYEISMTKTGNIYIYIAYDFIIIFLYFIILL